MSIIISGDKRYNYDPIQLKQALRDKGLSDPDIEKVLVEIKQGDFQSLKKLELDHYVWLDKGGLDSPESGMDLGALGITADALNQVDLVRVMTLLHETSKKLREANREMRHAQRDQAMEESLNAAQKTRDAALAGLCFGVVTGSINVAMGVASIASASVQLTRLKSPTAEMKAATLETKQNTAATKLSESQAKLHDARADLTAKQQARAGAEAKQAAAKKDLPEAEAKAKRLQDEYDAMAKGGATKEALAGKKAELDGAKKELADMEALAGDRGDADVKAAKSAEADADKAVKDLESEVNEQVPKCRLANDEARSSLAKEVKAKDKEIAGLNKKIEGTPKDSPERAGLEKKLGTAQKELTALKDKQTQLDRFDKLLENPLDETVCAGAADRHLQYLGMGAPVGSVGLRFATAQAELAQVNSSIQSVNNVLLGLNSSVGGVNQALSAGGEYMASMRKAESSEATAASQKAASAEAESADFQKSFNDLLQSVQTIIKEALQAQTQAQASIYRNM